MGGKSCSQVVMVANEDAPDNTVFFSIPLSEPDSRKLSAVESSSKTPDSMGHSGDTPDR